MTRAPRLAPDMPDRQAIMSMRASILPTLVLPHLVLGAVLATLAMQGQWATALAGRPLGMEDLLLPGLFAELALLLAQLVLWRLRFGLLSRTIEQMVTQDAAEIPWQNRRGALGQLAEALLKLRQARRGTKVVLERSRETHAQLQQESSARREAEVKNLLALSVYAHLDEAVFFSSPQGVILQVNPAFERLLGYPAHRVEGRTSAELLMPDNPALHQAIMGVLRRDGLWQGEAALRRADNRHLPTDLTCRAIKDADGTIRHVMGVFQDLSERRSARARLHELTHHDPLTGRLNRASFMSTLREVLAARQAPIQALLLVGIDRLKAINDTLGHRTGDHVLREVAHRLGQTLRKNDILARIGGDEFAILMPAFENTEQAKAFAMSHAESLLTRLRDPIQLDRDHYSLKITASLGIAFSPHDGNQAEALLQAADLALLAVKRAGRDQASLYLPSLGERINQRFRIEQGLRRALENREFEIFMQPLIEAGSAELKGFECLIRWTQGGTTPISPADFIPVAEEIGMIEPITEWIVREGCRHLASWRRSTRRELFISINLSPRHLLRDDLAQMLLEALRPHGLSASALLIELTEGGLVGGLELVHERIHHLAMHGFQIAIDDFGTGHSSLGMLTELPIDKLKIDQSFVRDRVPHDPEAVKVLDAMLALARELQLPVVVEGVETLEQAQLIRSRNSQALLQGFYFDRPQSAFSWDGRLLDGTLPNYKF